jgi:solute carrier family 25 protein 39/40
MSVPATVIYLVGYEGIREALFRAPLLRAIDGPVKDFTVPLVAGSSARIAAVTMISPLELLKTKMQHRGKDGGLVTIAREIASGVQAGGIRVLYKGLVPTLFRDVPFSAIYWAGYESFRNFYSQRFAEARLLSNLDNFLLSFMAGASSGMVAAALTTPFDVAKTRQQVSNLSQLTSSKSISRHLVEIWQSEGAAGLTRGIIPRICKVAPSCAIMVGTYEFGKSYLASQRRPS